ncbi:hypothetical protein [Nonomuraea wenchangensis]|uniref:hypothetical protein n=1 Tax=Nonomuraea wenchangensis TaxID=568860 RepID=UPI00332DC2B6
MAYATEDDLVPAYLATAPAQVDLLLVRASRLVDQALLAAVYDAEDADVQTALQEATCEQVAAWAAVGEDGTGASAEYANVSIGSVSLGRAQSGGAGGGGSAATRLAPQAFAVLQQAGLTGHSPSAC